MKLSKRTCHLIGAAVLICSLDTAYAATIQTSVGNGADTFLRSCFGDNACNTNFGSIDFVAVKNDPVMPGISRKIYLRFDLSGFIGPIVDASLSMNYVGNTGTNAPQTYSVFGLNDGHAEENWDELAITWNNAPGNNTSSSGGFSAADTVFLGSFDLNVPSAVPGDPVSFSSPELLTFLLSDSNDLATLLITRQNVSTFIETFASKENVDWAAPRLTLSEIPVPAAAWLFGSALGLLGWIRRKAS